MISHIIGGIINMLAADVSLDSRFFAAWARNLSASIFLVSLSAHYSLHFIDYKFATRWIWTFTATHRKFLVAEATFKINRWCMIYVIYPTRRWYITKESPYLTTEISKRRQLKFLTRKTRWGEVSPPFKNLAKCGWRQLEFLFTCTILACSTNWFAQRHAWFRV